ncbi:hypothetical protein J4N45_11075 [Vibrio sp. SCSIO 43140]|uniref:hypothetical protein n=1 Tax=Vibrio sp. SCSIO 43140 TaxID=2819100 RepID=UPI0020752B39|nr:hypothetical protein [Vibrio sp. SCSIO 43140]USD59073.1 hypothetical protein J4N45_11075 [Vibrio sp. SCSIO 43140]
MKFREVFRNVLTESEADMVKSASNSELNKARMLILGIIATSGVGAYFLSGVIVSAIATALAG